MKKKLLSLAVCLSIVFSCMGTTHAAKSVSQLKEDLSANQKKVDQTKKEIKSKQAEQSAQRSQKDALDIEIAGLQDDIDEVQSVIDEKNADIAAKNKEITSLDNELKKTDKQLKKRMKVVYESGTTSYLELILQADGISDLFTRLSVVESILKHDNEMMDNFEAQITQLSEAKKVVENEKNEQIEARQILESKQSAIESKKAEKEKIISALSSDINELKRQEAEAEKAEKQLQAQINAALKAASQKNVTYSGNGKFGFPLTSYTKVTSPFGWRIHPITNTKKFHSGIDYSAPYGTTILAAEDGVVLTSGWNSGYGYCVTVNHGGGYVTLYGHCSSLLVSAGQSVKRGQAIARVGSTGNSTGNHLHFEVRSGGSAVNPAGFL
ncbi:MAG: peptidoglycan DD-metalloendopeptidase family protein [Clostridiales bacterium]|nr:peptidoglycan DD-metalloendopeptidase family protein [Clostridiales bacterium]